MSLIKVNSTEFYSKIDKLTNNGNLNRIEKRVLRKGLSEIRKATKSALRSSLPNASKRSNMYDDRLIDGVMQSIVEEGNEIIGKVHIMGTRRSTSGTYRLRFFEGGTKERIKKSTGKSTGHIGALNFFESARSSSESNAMNKIEQEWDNEIIKLLE